MKNYLLINNNGCFMVTEFEDGFTLYFAVDFELYCKLSHYYDVVDVRGSND